MPVRLTTLFSVTTDPTDRGSAAPHSGGWSESMYVAGETFMLPGSFSKFANVRGEPSCGGVFDHRLPTTAGNDLGQSSSSRRHGCRHAEHSRRQHGINRKSL